jgi:hypothetical protein
MSIEQLSSAEAAVRTIALINDKKLREAYGTSREDVEALVELAHEMWFRRSKERS